MPGFGTNSAMGSASLPARVEYNASNLPSGYVYDQGLSYPATNGYAYYTGFEPPTDWSEQSNFWGADCQNLQLSTNNLPYVYCAPGYGFSYSSPDQYTYMPGMIMGVDGSFVGSQQYFASQYQPDGLVSGYFPLFIQPTADLSSTVSLNSPIFSTGTSVASRPANTSRSKHQMSGNTTPASQSVPSGNPAIGPSQHVNDNQNTNKPFDSANLTRCDKPSTSHLAIPFDASSADKNFQVTSGACSSGDREPREDKVSPVTTMGEDAQTKAMSSSSLENIVIHPDQYNKDDFPFDHPDAKFFVIKSYSEDDVHKSVKYNVWSSTPNGNRRLDAAYSDAQKKTPRKCPIFLFFSVNTSGQFCGVAEMVGPVAFHKDMDFWQQDKWSGSFPVKWHLVKDVANSTFRHIILENNENKPVTNSRDTQEIPYKSGIEMLRLFKSTPMTTSILDDFPFYEGRQKAMLEQKRRQLGRSFDGRIYIPAFVAKINAGVVGDPSKIGKGECSRKDTHLGKNGQYSGASEQPDKTNQIEDGVVIKVPKRDGPTLVEQPEYVKSDQHSLDARVDQQNENCSGPATASLENVGRKPVEQPEYVKSDQHSLDARVDQQNENCSGPATASLENVGRKPAGFSELVELNGKGYSGREVQPQISPSESKCSSGGKSLHQELGGHDPSDCLKDDASRIAKDIKSIKLLKKPEGLSTCQVDRQAKGTVNQMTGISPTGVVKVGSVCIKVNLAGESSSEIIGDGMGSLAPKGAEHSEQANANKS